MELKGSKTEKNLQAAFAGESQAHTKYGYYAMYPEFAKVAREEGFDKIAFLFDHVGKIEKHHEERYRDLLANVESGAAFKRPEKRTWVCRNCGFILEAEEAPKVCPVCSHPQAFFELLVQDY